ncbi:hypothetical protein [Brevibacillus borstelensis]|jgi:hypothetical protein|uniref:hypothetical protein n=1 Tax=Brevibacillus sp. FSL K6-2834 TaxID=2954680 RepID=UPI0011CE92D9
MQQKYENPVGTTEQEEGSYACETGKRPEISLTGSVLGCKNRNDVAFGNSFGRIVGVNLKKKAR